MRDALPHVHYTDRKLDTVERPKFFHEYWVTGRGVFPFDMLRYDHAWPAGESQSYKLEAGFYGERAPLRSVKLWSHKSPTIARWDSFNWVVTATEPVGTKFPNPAAAK